MNIVIKVFATFTLLLTAPNALSSESVSPAPVADDGYTIDVRDTPADFKIPAQLWDKLMAKNTGDKKASGGGGHGETAATDGEGDTLIVWLPINVVLSAKSSGILVHQLITYRLPRGGGTIDLAKNTMGDKGTFSVKFDLAEFANPAALKIYFVSNAKKRRVDGEVFGAGCNVFFDVTASVLASSSSEGIKFNVTNNRHISALSGHFIFAQSEKDKVFLSQVEFNDSQNRDYLCKN